MMWALLLLTALVGQQENIAICNKLFYNSGKAVQDEEAGKQDEGSSKHI